MVTDLGDLTFVREEGGRSFQLAWIDRQVEVRGVLGEPNPSLADPAISPDGKQVALSYEADELRDIWVLGIDGAPRRLTFHEETQRNRTERTPAWSSDGTDVVFSRLEAGMTVTAYAVAANGSGSEREPFPGSDLHFSRDGRHAVFHDHDAASEEDLWIAEIPDGGRIEEAETRRLLEGEKRQRRGRLSPAGDLLAYELSDGEQTELYVTQFPSAEGRWQVSIGGGRQPRWSHDGSRLYFLDDDLALHEVSVRTTPSIRFGRSKLLFANGTNGVDLSRGYDVVAADRLLVVRVVSDDRKRYIAFVQNWFREFEGD